MNNIEKIDKNLAVAGTLAENDLAFRNVRSSPFTIHGLLYEPESGPFLRIPKHIAEKTNEGTFRLHTNTAGGRVRFRTNSSRIAIRAVTPGKCLMPHMPFLGSSGFDLYEQTDIAYVNQGFLIRETERKYPKTFAGQTLIHLTHRIQQAIPCLIGTSKQAGGFYACQGGCAMANQIIIRHRKPSFPLLALS